MKHILNLVLGFIITALTYSCAERAICPAYQSAFIHDKTALDKHFSYFGEDSLPKVLTASKDKFLIIEKEPYRKKVRSFNTVPMQTIYPVLDDSTQLAGDVQMIAELDVVDSVALDSIAKNTLPWKEKFNVEQEFYLHYFNDILVYPEERLQAELEAKEKKNTKSKEKQPFFKRIFGGLFSKNDETDSLTEEGEIAEKKGFFGKLFGGKKDKSSLNKESEEDDDNTPLNEQQPVIEEKTPEDDSSGEDDF